MKLMQMMSMPETKMFLHICGKGGIIKMNKKQYNNIIMHSLQYNCKDSKTSLDTARIIFDNMGVALPVGTIDDVCEILKTDDYMGWRACTSRTCAAGPVPAPRI